MFKLDDNLLQEIGLGALPPQEKNRMLNHIYETLEMNVGMKLAEKMSNEQLDEFERFINGDIVFARQFLDVNKAGWQNVPEYQTQVRNDQAAAARTGAQYNENSSIAQFGALTWLETNFPTYKDVVAAELDKLKQEVKGFAPQILADSAARNAQLAAGGQSLPPGAPAAQPMPGQPLPGQPMMPPQPMPGAYPQQPLPPAGYAPQPQYRPAPPTAYGAPQGYPPAQPGVPAGYPAQPMPGAYPQPQYRPAPQPMPGQAYPAAYPAQPGAYQPQPMPGAYPQPAMPQPGYAPQPQYRPAPQPMPGQPLPAYPQPMAAPAYQPAPAPAAGPAPTPPPVGPAPAAAEPAVPPAPANPPAPETVEPDSVKPTDSSPNPAPTDQPN